MHTAEKHDTQRLFLFLSFVIPFLGLTCFWAFFIRSVYFPFGDEFALLVASARMFHPSIRAWFLDGFSHYFLAYPGLSHPSTDFIRPVANFTYYFDSLIFGSHWSYYLLVNYIVQAGLVCVTTRLALEVLLLSRRSAILVGILCFLSPAFGWQAMFFPSFVFDLLAALSILYALLQLWRQRYVSAWILLTLAVFTKETALFAPIVIAGASWVRGGKNGNGIRRFGNSLVWMVPVFGWALVRHFAFHGNGGVYVYRSFTLREQIPNVLHGFLSWPFGTRSMNQNVHYRFLFFTLNATFWAGVLYVLTGFLRANRSHVKDTVAACKVELQGERKDIFPFLLLFTAGAVLMPIFLNLPQRFGAAFYPLLSLCLVCLVSSVSSRVLRRGAAMAIVASLTFAVFQKIIDPTTLAETKAEWILARSYVQAIRSSSVQSIVVIDDVTGGFATSEIIARFAGFHGALMRSNNVNLVSIAHCAGDPWITSAIQGHELRIISFLPPSCGLYAFDGITPETLRASTQGLLLQTKDGREVRVFQPSFVPLPPSDVPVLYGRMVIEMNRSSTGRMVLVPNLKELSYQELQ